MPPRRQESDDDAALTVRFKNGFYTIALLVDPMAPFSRITADLIDHLKECYPDGLSGIPLAPTSPDVQVVYALPKHGADLALGWTKPLDLDGDPSAVARGLKNNCIVGFALLEKDEEVNAGTFAVESYLLDE